MYAEPSLHPCSGDKREQRMQNPVKRRGSEASGDHCKMWVGECNYKISYRSNSYKVWGG